MKNKIILLVGLFLSAGVFYGFVDSNKDRGYEIVKNDQFKNLQVLPQDISEEALEEIMEGFNEALGVKCTFCHVMHEPMDFDFASDDKMQKNVARGMMRMTMDINKNYFNTENPMEFSVNCYTCHQGEATPALGPPPVVEAEEAAEAVVE